MNWESIWQTRSLASTSLLPASWLYALALRARTAPNPTRVEGLKVISVGNLIVGGAGKTPVVMFLAEWALREGRRVAVLSRGYGRIASHPVHWQGGQPLPAVIDMGDEPRLIARRFLRDTNAFVFVDSNRIAAARAARSAGCEVAILDDGFQHRRLHRDVDMLIDAGIANGRMLPAGPLREPLSASQRAHIISSRDGASDLTNPTALRVEAAHEAVSVLEPDGTEAPISSLSGTPVVALAGLARPLQFIATLRAAGANVVESHLYPDHHLYSAQDLERVQRGVREKNATLVTTEKDRERLPESVRATLVRMSVRITHGQPALAQRLGFRLTEN